MSKDLNVLHLIDHLGLGGAQTVVEGIIEGQKDGDICYVNNQLYSLRQSQFNKKEDHPDIQVYPSSSKYSLKPLFIIKRYIETQNINVLHCHLFRSQCFGWILKTIFFPGIPLIFHEHGRIISGNELTNIFIRIIRKDVDLFIAVSKFIEKNLINKTNIPPQKIKILNNYVNTKKFNSGNVEWNIDKEKSNLGIQKDDFVVGFAGRMIRMKGWKEFLTTASLMRNEDNVKFLMAGEGRERRELITVIKKMQLDRKVTFLGYVEDMVWFYSILDCFIVPSWWEAWGVTVLEAQALEVPVIAADAPALNEIITDRKNGLLFKPKNPEDLKQKIKLVYEDGNLRRKLIHAGQETAQKCSFQVYIQNLYDIYFSRSVNR